MNKIVCNKYLILTTVATMLFSCKSIVNTQEPFQVVDAFYYSWVKSENERGTKIIVKLNNKQDNIEFQSIIFGGHKLPIVVSDDNGEIIVEGIQTHQLSSLNVESVFVGKPDQLCYSYKGKMNSRLLPTIRRENTVYY